MPIPAGIPENLKIDFSSLERDLITEGLEKMLSCFYDACTLREFVAILLTEVQELYDEAIEVERLRTLYFAEGVNLDANGRIVGQDRMLWEYDEEQYFMFDVQGLGWDQAPWYCTNAPLGVYVEADDDVYRTAILQRIVKNHTLTASVPELCQLIQIMLGIKVSFIKCGPMQVRLAVNSGISKGELYQLTNFTTDTRVENTYLIPYPATLNFCEGIIFLPDNPFFFDRGEPYQWDSGEWAVFGAFTV